MCSARAWWPLRVESSTEGRTSTYRRLENTLIAPVGLGGLLDLLLRGVRVDDAVLAGNLLAVLLAVLALDALVRVELRLEKGAERLQLGLLGLAGGVVGAGEVALEALDAVLDGRVADLGLGDVLLELLVGLRVGGAERALVQLADGANVVGQAVDVVAQGLDAGEEVLLGEGGSAAGGGGGAAGGAGGRLLVLVVRLRGGVRLRRGLLVVVVLELIVVVLVVRVGLEGIGGLASQVGESRADELLSAFARGHSHRSGDAGSSCGYASTSAFLRRSQCADNSELGKQGEGEDVPGRNLGRIPGLVPAGRDSAGRMTTCWAKRQDWRQKKRGKKKKKLDARGNQSMEGGIGRCERKRDNK